MKFWCRVEYRGSWGSDWRGWGQTQHVLVSGDRAQYDSALRLLHIPTSLFHLLSNMVEYARKEDELVPKLTSLPSEHLEEL